MTCRAPHLAAALAALQGDPPPDDGSCSAPVEFSVVLPEVDGVQLSADVCHWHARTVALQFDGTRLVKKR